MKYKFDKKKAFGRQWVSARAEEEKPSEKFFPKNSVPLVRKSFPTTLMNNPQCPRCQSFKTISCPALMFCIGAALFMLGLFLFFLVIPILLIPIAFCVWIAAPFMKKHGYYCKNCKANFKLQKDRDISDLLEFLKNAKDPAILMHPDMKAKLPVGSTSMPFYGIQIIVSEDADKSSISGLDMHLLRKAKFFPPLQS